MILFYTQCISYTLLATSLTSTAPKYGFMLYPTGCFVFLTGSQESDIAAGMLVCL